MKEKKSKDNTVIQTLTIDNAIYIIRNQKVMLDEDLANIYGVETRVLNQAIRRNIERFPEGFMFKLTVKEYSNLMSQIVTSNRGGRRKMPFVFTEHGTVMLASVLRSKRAIEMNIEVIKAFVRIQNILTSNKDILNQLAEIRSFMLKKSNNTDSEFKKVWKAIEDLSKSAEAESSELIGFKVED